MAHQFKVGDRVQWSARAIAEGMGSRKGCGPFVVLAVDPVPSARLRGVPSAGDPNGWFHFNWLEPAPALIDAAKTYQTRDGRAVRIYATDGGGDEPIHGAYQDSGGDWYATSWLADGTYFSDIEDERDLIEVKPEREGWINIDRYRSGALLPRCEFWKDKEIADRLATPNRIACLHLKFREGEGL